MPPTFLKTVNSHTDNTVKYVFRTEAGSIIEVAYINKNDGKDIICLPSQTMCEMACKFCHTTEYIGKIKTINLTSVEIVYVTKFIVDAQKLTDNNRTLLISFMGCGEPILNSTTIVFSMNTLKEELEEIGIPYVRFSLATSLPESASTLFFAFCSAIKKSKLQVKLHLSLHYTDNELRKEWMSKSMSIEPSIAAVQFYKTFTGNDVEIHYALVNGVNDKKQNAWDLALLLSDKDMPVKFLFYNKKDTSEYTASDKNRLTSFYELFDTCGISYEYYIPPGLDIGASCGQFFMDYYVEEQLIK